MLRKRERCALTVGAIAKSTLGPYVVSVVLAGSCQKRERWALPLKYAADLRTERLVGAAGLRLPRQGRQETMDQQTYQALTSA